MTWYEGPICGSPGIGALQARFTVKVHPQVDRKLENVLFTEGRLAPSTKAPPGASVQPKAVRRFCGSSHAKSREAFRKEGTI
jgi:hypothetical protein